MLFCSRQVGAFSSGCMELRYRGGGNSVPCFGSRAETSVTSTEEGVWAASDDPGHLSSFLFPSHGTSFFATPMPELLQALLTKVPLL